MRFRFGEFELDEGEATVQRAGERLSVEPKVFDLLCLLVRRHGRLVATDVVVETLWPDAVVGEAALHRVVMQARRLVGDDGRQQRVIETVRGRGLRFRAPTEEIADEDEVVADAYVGRAEVVARIDELVDQTMEGQGRVLLLSGAAGLGKTRTAEELVTRARLRGAEVATAWASEEAGVPAYWPWIQVLRAMMGARDERTLRRHLGPSGPELAELEPGLRERLPDLARVSSLAPEHGRVRLFDAVRSFLSRAAVDQPLVVVLDDLHWADSDALDLLRRLVEPGGGDAVLIVGCHRESELALDPRGMKLVERLATHPSVESIRLAPLSPTEIADFVARRSGSRPSAEVIEDLRIATGGNPLFLGEMLRAGTSLDGVQLNGAASRAYGQADVIDAWLGALPESARRELRAAAAVAQEFEAGAVRGTRSDGVAFDAALREGVDARVLVPVAHDRYRFAHAALREALYGELGERERAAVHLAIGTVLERADRPGHGVDALAHHFFTAFAGGDAQKAIDYSERAGDEAAAVYASERAASYYRKALQVLELQRRHDPRRQCELLIKLGRALSGVADREGARAACRRAVEIARREDWPDTFAVAAAGFAAEYLYLAPPDPETVSLLEEALGRLGPEASAMHARLLARLASELCMHPDRTQRQEVRRRAFEAAGESAAPESLAHVLASSAYTGVLENCVSLDERLALLERAVESSSRSDDLSMALQVRLLLAEEYLARGSCARHDEAVAAARRGAFALGDPVSIVTVGFRQFTRLLMQGRFEEAELRTNEIFAYARERLDPRAAAQLWLLSQVVLGAERGRLGSLLRVLEASDSGGDGSLTVTALRAWVYCEAGEMDRARSLLDTILSELLPDVPDFPVWEAQCAVIAHLCRELEAREYSPRLQTLLEPLRGRLVTRRHVVCHGPASFYLALLAELQGSTDEAEQLLAEAAATAEAVAAPPWLARTRFAQARLLVESRREEEARARGFLAQAIALSRELGMARILDQASRLADAPGKARRSA